MHRRSIAPMKTAKIGYIFMSALICVFGIIIIAVPDLSINVVGVVFGILLIVFGAIKLVGYFSKDLFRLAFQYDLAFGALLVVLGIILLVNTNEMMSFLFTVFGLTILADSLFKVQIAVDSKRFGIGRWWLILISAILASVLGLMLLFKPTESARVMMVLLGITLLAEGILNLCTVVTSVKIIRNQKPDVIEAEFEERDE